MLISPVRVSRPELRAKVLELVRRVREQPDCASFPMVGLVQLLGIQVAPEFHEQLEARGDIRFDRERFENTGEAIRRRVRLGGVEMNLAVAADLRGDLVRGEDSVRLTFEPGHSVRLSKLLIRARLHSLGVFQDHIDVDVRGGAGLRIDLV